MPGRNPRPRAAEAPTAPAARRSQIERSAATRAKLINAAIRCLNRDGYSAVAVASIADQAGVSKGGMQHQFPTKVDLMLAVVEFASGYDERALAPVPDPDRDPLEQFLELTESAWRLINRPHAMAKLEVMIASRSDKVLAARLPGILQKIERRRRDAVFEYAKAAGITNRAAIDTMVFLHMAAMNGLAIESMVNNDREMIEQSIKLLMDYKISLVRRLLAEDADQTATEV